jgi:RNA polymerase-binding transcription factor DksA
VDDIDVAQLEEMRMRDEALARQRRIAESFAPRNKSVEGICIDCDQAIDPARLKAISTARCIHCAQIFEARLRGMEWT